MMSGFDNEFRLAVHAGDGGSCHTLDLPLVEMLGRAHQAIPTSITIGIKSIEESLVEAEEYRSRG